jgi:AraC-like DNA-binding protein
VRSSLQSACPDRPGFTEYFDGVGAAQPEHRSAGLLKLLRVPHREAGSFCIPRARGVSIRMNRSDEKGTKTVDYGFGRFTGSLDRHYTVAPASVKNACEITAAIDFLAVEFAPDAFEDHLGSRSDLGRLHAGFQKDELVMLLVERLWCESAEGLAKLEADAISAALVALLVRASRLDSSRPRPNRVIRGRQVGRLLDYIEGHLTDDFSISDLSRATGCSTADITSRLRVATGLSPWQFVMLRRVERARTLLTNSQSTISEIALKCGFSSSQHFATAFKRQVGATPSAYRRGWSL